MMKSTIVEELNNQLKLVMMGTFTSTAAKMEKKYRVSIRMFVAAASISIYVTIEVGF